MTYNTINDAVTMPGGEGTLLANRYRIVRQLGQGGMGSVWLAEDTKLRNRLFAIKMLPSVLVRNKKAYRQLGDEALVAMKLTHPNIVTLRAFEEDNGNPFLVMDYIDGQTLDDYLAEKGKLSEVEAIKLLKPIAAALDYAHDEHVVHRDVKPANVMIRNDGHPFILDFGIAREIQETMTRVTGKLSSGTLLYMSPEQLRGLPPNYAQDVYSFSAMVYECISGHPPFYRGAVEDQIKNEMPESLPASIAVAPSVMAGLEKNPKARPSSCSDVLAPHGRPCPRPWSRQGTIGGDKTIEFEPEPSESIRRNWAWWWIAGSSIVFALLVAGGFLWKVSSSHDIATGPSVPAVPAVTVLPVNVEPPVPSPSEQAHIAEEQDRLKAEATHLRNEIADQYGLATNVFNKIAQYRNHPEGFVRQIENVDSFWRRSSSIVLSDNATLEQLNNVLMSVSNVVVGIQGEERWIAENMALRDEILSVLNNACSIRDSFASIEGTHWQTLPRYVDGTNSLTIASERLAKGELASALESISIATNHLQTAYSDELKFIADEKKRITEEMLKVETQKLADEARAYTNSLEQIALLRRDASNEHAKVAAILKDQEGFEESVDKIEVAWRKIVESYDVVVNMPDEHFSFNIMTVQEKLKIVEGSLRELRTLVKEAMIRLPRRDSAREKRCRVDSFLDEVIKILSAVEGQHGFSDEFSAAKCLFSSADESFKAGKFEQAVKGFEIAENAISSLLSEIKSKLCEVHIVAYIAGESNGDRKWVSPDEFRASIGEVEFKRSANAKFGVDELVFRSLAADGSIFTLKMAHYSNDVSYSATVPIQRAAGIHRIEVELK